MNSKEKDFNLLIQEHRSTIYMVCYMFCKNQTEVSDLMQEVLINLWLSYPQFHGKSDIRTWIYRVSMNVCISLNRKKRRQIKSVPLTMNINPYDEEDTPSRQIDALRKRIARLQPIDRAIILLWLENLSYEEIAEIVGIKVNYVSVRLYRIKEILKQMSND